MRRMLCVAAAALAFLLPALAEARTPIYARAKCVGLNCWIVTEPASRPEPLPATWRRGWAPRRAPRRRARPYEDAGPDPVEQVVTTRPKSREKPWRRAAAIARKQPWCDPKRVAECYGCACIKDARRELRRLGR
jgi:hypothetical protein